MITKSMLITGLAGLFGLGSLTVVGCGTDRALDPIAPGPGAGEQVRSVDPVLGDNDLGKIVVANRGSGTISVLDAASGALLDDFDLPSDPNPPEPMYVVYVKETHSVLVGDRANSRIVEFGAEDFAVHRTAAAGAGVFHMWADPARNRQLWVNNDIDNTATVIDPVMFEHLATVPMPADLVMGGAKPHDVVLDPKGRYAYVTLLAPGPSDYVVQFDTSTFLETARATVGKDPHVSVTRRNDLLYVPCQESDVVQVLDRRTLSLVTTLSAPGAHGAGMTQSGRFFYATNLTGGGLDGLYTIDTRTNAIVGDPVDTPYAVPHNLAATKNGQRLFLTHSGMTADKVTFYSISAADPAPVLLGETTVGLNPFGITFVP